MALNYIIVSNYFIFDTHYFKNRKQKYKAVIQSLGYIDILILGGYKKM